MAYTYDEQILSDLHKDARGFRPRELFWSNWKSSNQDEKQAIWDGLLQELNDEMEREHQEELRATAEFEQRISKIQSALRCDRNAAIRIYVDSLGLTEHDRWYGASYICFESGLPYRMAQTFVDAGAATHIG